MDNLAARLFICIEGSGKSYVLWNGTETYYKKLRSAYTDILKSSETEYLHFSFFTLCAATLEYSLNFILTNFCLDHFGQDKYKSFAEGYINMSFQKKLLMTPSIISNGKLTINESGQTFKTLSELITLRNRILHNKEFLQEINFPSISDSLDKEQIEFQLVIEPNHIETLNRDSCIRFGTALGDFKKHLMDQALNNKLTENTLLLKL